MTKQFKEGLEAIGEERIQAFMDRIHSGDVFETLLNTITKNGTVTVEYDISKKELVVLPDNRLGLMYSLSWTRQLDENQTLHFSGAYVVHEEGVFLCGHENVFTYTPPLLPEFEEIIYIAPVEYLEDPTVEKRAVIGQNAKAV